MVGRDAHRFGTSLLLRDDEAAQDKTGTQNASKPHPLAQKDERSNRGKYRFQGKNQGRVSGGSELLCPRLNGESESQAQETGDQDSPDYARTPHHECRLTERDDNHHEDGGHGSLEHGDLLPGMSGRGMPHENDVKRKHHRGTQREQISSADALEVESSTAQRRHG